MRHNTWHSSLGRNSVFPDLPRGPRRATRQYTYGDFPEPGLRVSGALYKDLPFLGVFGAFAQT